MYLIKNHVSGIAYSTWFKFLQPQFDHNKLVIKAHDEMALGIIRNRYGDMLKQIVNQIYGIDYLLGYDLS